MADTPPDRAPYIDATISRPEREIVSPSKGRLLHAVPAVDPDGGFGSGADQVVAVGQHDDALIVRVRPVVRRPVGLAQHEWVPDHGGVGQVAEEPDARRVGAASGRTGAPGDDGANAGLVA
jgi:hypothetical protein